VISFVGNLIVKVILLSHWLSCFSIGNAYTELVLQVDRSVSLTTVIERELFSYLNEKGLF
jgi:hypothetical protein